MCCKAKAALDFSNSFFVSNSFVYKPIMLFPRLELMSLIFTCIDVQSHVLTFLDCKSLLMLSQTSKSQRHSAKDYKCKRAVALMNALFGELTLMPDLKRRIAVYEAEPENNLQMPDWDDFQLSIWKRAKRRQTIALSVYVEPNIYNIVVIESWNFHDQTGSSSVWLISPSFTTPCEGMVYLVEKRRVTELVDRSAKDFVRFLFERIQCAVVRCKSSDISWLHDAVGY